METIKRSFRISLLLSAVVLFPIALYGQGQGGEMADQITANSPPVAQPLVPEGVFAVELVKALKIGQAQNEAEAESMLSTLGIEPRNGWIADYPVTPDIIGEIEESMSAAADAKKLEMGKDQAQKAVQNLVARMGLNVMPGPSSPPAEAAPAGGTVNVTIYKYIDEDGGVHFTDRYESIPKKYRDQIQTIREEARTQLSVGAADEAAETQPSNNYTTDNYTTNHYTANPNPEVINNYYYNDGPPVVTYYTPPWPYYYMYVWVPYPFWCSRVFFPGFFILHDFHRTLIVNKQVFRVTNHVVNPRTKTVFIVDPLNRNPGGRGVVNRAASPQVFGTASAQASARAILGLSQQKANSVRVTTEPRIRNGAPSTPLSRSQPQVRSNGGANYPMETPPAIINRGKTANSVGSDSSTMKGKPPLRPSFAEKRNETNLPKSLPREVRPFNQPLQPSGRSLNSRPFNEQKTNQPRNPTGVSSPRVQQRESVKPGNIGWPRVAERRTFTSPATSGGSFNSNPPGRVFTPPPATQNRVIPTPAAKGSGSAGGSRSGVGGSIGNGFFRGGGVGRF